VSGVTYINVIYRVTNELNLSNEKKTKVYFHPAEIARRGSVSVGPAGSDLGTDDTPSCCSEIAYRCLADCPNRPNVNVSVTVNATQRTR
jgi:hypothetical protein